MHVIFYQLASDVRVVAGHETDTQDGLSLDFNHVTDEELAYQKVQVSLLEQQILVAPAVLVVL